MKHIDCYLDFISPYAYLAFERLPRALEGLSYQVSYRPILFAGLLQHHGQLGPAEIAPKRDWTYRQVLWLAREHGIAMDLPAAHPFNPLALPRADRGRCARRCRVGRRCKRGARRAALNGGLWPSLVCFCFDSCWRLMDKRCRPISFKKCPTPSTSPHRPSTA